MKRGVGARLIPFSINKKPLPPCGRGLTVDLRRANLACLPAAYKPVIIIRATRRRLRSRLLFVRVIIVCVITYSRTRRSIPQKLQNCQVGIWELDRIWFDSKKLPIYTLHIPSQALRIATDTHCYGLRA